MTFSKLNFGSKRSSLFLSKATCLTEPNMIFYNYLAWFTIWVQEYLNLFFYCQLSSSTKTFKIYCSLICKTCNDVGKSLKWRMLSRSNLEFQHRFRNIFPSVSKNIKTDVLRFGKKYLFSASSRKLQFWQKVDFFAHKNFDSSLKFYLSKFCFQISLVHEYLTYLKYEVRLQASVDWINKTCVHE